MSWADEAQLVRGSIDGFNLAIGEPHFLREFFQPYYPRHYPADLSYPDSHPSEELREELRRLHPGEYVVVTCGAKQALHAAVHALAPEQKRVLVHQTPYWPSYPTIAEYGGLTFYDGSDGPLPRTTTLTCITSPNNPNGSEHGGLCDIWDAAYAHRVYGWSGNSPGYRISVWSAGKMLGNPGVRVGWLTTPEEKLAERARQYVEQMTSGVPTISQHHVAATLRNTAHNREQLYAAARSILRLNEFEVCRLFDPMRISHVAIGKGMFAWVLPNDPDWFHAMCRGAGVRVVDGAACGKSGWVRISLGNDLLTTRAAVDTLLAHTKEKP